MNPTDTGLIERDKLKKFLQEEKRQKKLLTELGYFTETEEEEESVPVSTSISEDIYKLCYSGIFVFSMLILLSCCIYHCNKYRGRSQKYIFNRDNELREIRRMQQLEL